MRLGARLGLLALLALTVACKTGSERSSNGTPSASAPGAPDSALPELVQAPERPPPCRVLRVRGRAWTEAGTLANLTPIDGKRWVSLEADAEVVLRHAASARELSLAGPGRFLPCRGGLEQVLVASGRVTSAPGTGVRPGSELGIATPFGYLSYGDADLSATVEAGQLRVVVRNGNVAAEPAPGTTGLPATVPAKPNQFTTATGSPDPKALVEHCERLASEAAAAARRVLGAGGRTALGETAAAQLTARRRARAACAIAEAGSERTTELALRDRLRAQVVAAERLWRTVPFGGAAAASSAR